MKDNREGEAARQRRREIEEQAMGRRRESHTVDRGDTTGGAGIDAAWRPLPGRSPS